MRTIHSTILLLAGFYTLAIAAPACACPPGNLPDGSAYLDPSGDTVQMVPGAAAAKFMPFQPGRALSKPLPKAYKRPIIRRPVPPATPVIPLPPPKSTFHSAVLR